MLSDNGAQLKRLVKRLRGAPKGGTAALKRRLCCGGQTWAKEATALSSSHDNHTTERFHFEDDGVIPNHPRFELLVHRAAFAPEPGEPAVSAEQLFGANGWGGFWRDVIYPFHHYHSTCHEALGVARGWAEVRFGGESGGRTLRLEAGDVAVLPAGTGHRRIAASDDFQVVGAYPPGQPFDLIRDAGDHDAAVTRIGAVPTPATDPVFGPDGGLRTAWKTD